jgi:hypothetical protein
LQELNWNQQPWQIAGHEDDALGRHDPSYESSPTPDEKISHKFDMLVWSEQDRRKLLGKIWVKRQQVWDQSNVFQKAWTYGVEDECSTLRRTWQNGENQLWWQHVGFPAGAHKRAIHPEIH